MSETGVGIVVSVAGREPGWPEQVTVRIGDERTLFFDSEAALTFAAAIMRALEEIERRFAEQQGATKLNEQDETVN